MIHRVDTKPYYQPRAIQVEWWESGGWLIRSTWYVLGIPVWSKVYLLSENDHDNPPSDPPDLQPETAK